MSDTSIKNVEFLECLLGTLGEDVIKPASFEERALPCNANEIKCPLSEFGISEIPL